MRYEIGFFLALGLFLTSMAVGCAKKESDTRPAFQAVTNVRCYSNQGELIFDGQAKGDVWVSYDSPRVEFRRADNGNLVVISGAECIVGNYGDVR
jgi:hypothetical protein